MSSRRIVLFDIDGTLLRGAGPHHKEALIDAARSVMGVECTFDGIETAGCLDQDLIYALLAKAGVSKRRILANMTLMREAAQHHYSVHCKTDFSDKLCPGVQHAIKLLAEQQIPMGLVTGNFSAIAWRKLENAGIDGYFSFGAFAEQATTRARIAKLAVWEARRKELAALRCSVVLIGDHANDIAAAQANRFRSVAVATGIMQVDELLSFQPDVVLRSLEAASIELIFGSR